MAEPLTRDKMLVWFNRTIAGRDISGLAAWSNEDKADYVAVEDLKSALEYLKAKMKGCMTNRDVQEEIEKAFPAIYEQEDKGDK